MDNVTHTLTGLLLSRAGLSSLSPRATWILLLSANAPDVDIVSGLTGPVEYLQAHRYLTHAFVSVPVMALLSVALIRLVPGRPRGAWTKEWLVACLGVLSHILLDWTNSYGIRLGLPWDTTWWRLDITSVVDYWLIAVFLIAALGPVLGRLVSSEIGARPNSGRGLAWAALAFTLGYEGLRAYQHGQAIALLNSRIYGEGQAPRRSAAFPHPGDPWRWWGVVETDDLYAVQVINLRQEFDPTRGKLLFKPEFTPAMEAARREPAFQIQQYFAAMPLWRAVPLGEPTGATRVELLDLRFGLPTNPHFRAEAVVDAQQHVVESRYNFGSAALWPEE